MKLIQWILKHLDAVHNDQWTKEKEVKMVTMGIDGKLKVIVHKYV